MESALLMLRGFIFQPQSQINKCNNEKRRRELENDYIEQLSEFMQINKRDMTSSKPDKAAILNEVVRTVSYFSLIYLSIFWMRYIQSPISAAFLSCHITSTNSLIDFSLLIELSIRSWAGAVPCKPVDY